jgi:hypothetical protein
VKDVPLALARGSTAVTTLDFVRRTYGAERLESILATLEPRQRTQLVSAMTTDELPYEVLLAFWRAADAALGREHPRWMEEAGAYAIDSLGQQLYSGLLHKASPAEFLTQSVSLFRLYYRPGDIVPVEVEPGRAVLRLIGFDAIGPLFCRRQTGGLIRASELAGGRDVRVKHVRCVHEGDLYCEWELRWR